MFILEFKYNMAGVAKRLRPRIVVPIRMGSNPITRPIKNLDLKRGLFYLTSTAMTISIIVALN